MRAAPDPAASPILIGGSGRQKTLRTVAERADAWNTSGSREEVQDALKTLERHCADVGRDPATIEKTVSFHIILRDDAGGGRSPNQEAARGERRRDRRLRRLRRGDPAHVADILKPYRDLGFETFIVRMPAPYDLETIERMREVAEILAR